MSDPVVEEVQKVSEVSLHEWLKFLDHPCWRELVIEAQQSCDESQRGMLQPMRNIEEALMRNYDNGRLVGVLSMSLNAATKVELLQREFDRQREAIENEQRSSGDGGNDAGSSDTSTSP